MSRSIEAQAAFTAIETLHLNYAERQELREAGVPSKTIEVLYPLNHITLAPGLLAHLKARPIPFIHIHLGIRKRGNILSALLTTSGMKEELATERNRTALLAAKEDFSVQEVNTYLPAAAAAAGVARTFGLEAGHLIGNTLWLEQYRNRVAIEAHESLDGVTIWVARTLLRLP